MSKINDVAKLAGVSISTVSNVLNGRTNRVGKATLARVEDAIARLDYRPNGAARQLKTGEARMIGLLVPSLGNPSYSMITREIEAYSWGHFGYRVIVGNTYRDPVHERAFLDDMVSQGVRGVIVISSLADESHIAAPVGRGLIAVSYDSHSRPNMRPTFDYVSADNAAGVRDAVDLLVGHGHRSLAFLSPDIWTFSRIEKRDAFLAAVAAAGAKATVIAGAVAPSDADAEMAELGQSLAAGLVRHRARPTAAVTINDMMAIGLMAGLRDLGLSVPDDMSVIGMDGIPLGNFTAPPLTTIRLPLDDLARTMVDRIMLRLKQPGTAPGEFRFPPALVERASVAPPPRKAGGRKA
jgi:DNA-binding LacI/PurR family transcriptional regulator